MKKISLTIVAIIAISHLSFSQTKRIMHRSHSGSDASLPADESDDSFGIITRREFEPATQDSIQAQKKADSIHAPKPAQKAGTGNAKTTGKGKGKAKGNTKK